MKINTTCYENAFNFSLWLMQYDAAVKLLRRQIGLVGFYPRD